jgi:hypothetical protein
MATQDPGAEYLILIHGDPQVWDRRTDDDNDRVDAAHREFTRRCGTDGHRVVASGELTDAATARVVRPGAGVTDGPYAELAEQIGGYYVVRTSDLDALLALVDEVLIGDPNTYEVRPLVVHDAATVDA